MSLATGAAMTVVVCKRGPTAGRMDHGDMVDVRETGTGGGGSEEAGVIGASLAPLEVVGYGPRHTRSESLFALLPPRNSPSHHKKLSFFSLRKAKATSMLRSMIPLATLTLIASACLPLSQGFSWVYAPSRQAKNSGMPETAIDGAFSRCWS